jgi:hypothetical protein
MGTGAARRRGRRVAVIGLVAAAVIPAAGAAAAVWADSGTGLASVRAERHGIQYLGQTVNLLVTVADAQSAAVRSMPPSPPDLAKAVAAVDASGLASDPAPGAGTLWAQIRPQVLALNDTPTTGVAAYRAYSQVTDLLLQQITAIDDASGLVPDSSSDAYHLIDALTVWLPDMAVQAGRYDDQVTLAEPPGAAETQPGAPQPDPARAAATAQVAVLRDRIAVDAHAFVTALNKVFRTTGSASLGPHLLGDVDLVNTDINALAPTASAIDEALVVPSAPTVSQDRKAFDPAVQVLETAGLAELDKLLQARETGYDTRRLEVAALLGGGVAVALPSLWWLWRRRGAGPGVEEETESRQPRSTARIGRRRSALELRTRAETPTEPEISQDQTAAAPDQVTAAAQPSTDPVDWIERVTAALIPPSSEQPPTRESTPTDPAPLTLPERRPR